MKTTEKLLAEVARRRLERAGKVLAAVMEGTIVNLGSLIYTKSDTGFEARMFSSKPLMNQGELSIAIQDVNEWLALKGVHGRIHRLDSGGSPEWGLVDN